MEAVIVLIILWAIALLILLGVLIGSLVSLNAGLSRMQESVERLTQVMGCEPAAPEPETQPEELPAPSVAETVPEPETKPEDLAEPPVAEAVPPPDPMSAEPEAVSPAAIFTAFTEEQLPSNEANAVPETASSESLEPLAASQAEETPEEPEPAEPREPTALEKRLKMLRNWLVYGRSEGVTEGEAVEKLLATTWLLRCGILVILFTTAFLLKLSIDRGILAPAGRVALAYLAGVAILMAGLSRRMRQRYWSLAQALCGLSLGVFYFSSFAMTSMYHLTSAMVSGAVMCLTTVTAGLLADRLNAISVALVAMVGGYATPLMLNTGTKNFHGLFAYLLLLGAGVLWLAIRRNWLQLNWLAMIFTYGIYALAVNARYVPEDDFVVCQTALVLFFVLFSTTVFIHNARRRLPATALEIFGLLGNSALFFGLSWCTIDTVAAGDRLCFAPLTLGLAAYYLFHAIVFGRFREPALRNLLLIFCALSGFYLALTFPVVFSGEWLAAAWAMQAFMMLWLGYRLDSRLVRNCAWLLYAVTLGHLAIYEFWLYDTLHAEGGTFWSGVISRIFQYLLPVTSLAAAARLTVNSNDVSFLPKPTENAAEEGNAQVQWLWMPRTYGELFAGVLLGFSFVVLFLFLRLEVGLDLGNGRKISWLIGVNLVWLGTCLAAIALLRKRLPGWWQLFLALLLGCTLLRAVADFFNTDFWRWATPWQFSWSECIGALCNTALLVLGIWLAGRLMPKGQLERILRRVCQVAWPVLLFVHSTREWAMIIKYKLPGLTGGGISVLWALFAFVLVFRGLTKSVRLLRYLGLGLFAVVVCKVFLFDLAHLDALYRVLAFLAFGLLLMGAAFIYLKFWCNATSPTTGKEAK